ncbi:MAG: hypothetical protein CVU48_01160 [Candidatus Cloacimonetes bacterium HGW-Cloacimonetes-1]|jgi:GTP-binding protein EngB required for normal cell division|nr:MAG: hypothetical protein CVU48_01160 [Candidatus Cloacimonetes bacterium HGW-Cloacimonetes-1]
MKPIYKQQAELIELCDTLEPLSKEYLSSGGSLSDWRKEINSYKAFIPLIGCYSAGKSSLLNALIDSKLFKVKIDPCTDIAFELSWGKQDTFILQDGDDIYPVSMHEIQTGSYSAKPNSIISITLDNEHLKAYPHLALVDLPGLQSGINAHSMAIDSYVRKSAAYLIVIDPEIGLRRDLIEFLLELRAFKVPVYCLITKSEKLHEDGLNDIVKKTGEQIEASFGRKADYIATASAKKKDLESVHKLLSQLENRSGELLFNSFNTKLYTVVSSLEKAINSRINNEALNDDELKAKEKEIIKQSADALRKVSDASERQGNTIQNTGTQLVMHIQQAMESNIYTLVSTVISHGDLNSQVGYICRKAFLEGYSLYVQPILKGYSSELESCIGNIHVESIRNETQANSHSEFANNASEPNFFQRMVSDIVKSIPLIGPIIGPIIVGVVNSIIDLFRDKKGSTGSQEEQKQQIEMQIRQETIAKVVNSIQGPIQEKLNAAINDMNRVTEETIYNNEESTKEALWDIQKQRTESAAAFEARKQKWQGDLEIVVKYYEYLS